MSSRDHGHKGAGQQVRSPRWSDPNSIVEPTRLALDVGKTEIKESKMTQDFWLELPFTKMRVGQGCVPGEVGAGVWRGGVCSLMSREYESGTLLRDW